MVRVTAQLPPNGYWAPPGYYMLAVTDEHQQPSPAVWIRLIDPLDP